jgi:hypothetical protein
VNEELCLEVEENNQHDRNAVAVMKNDIIVGHMPLMLARFSFFILKKGGMIKTVVTGHRRLAKGLEVPCDYIYTGPPRVIKKIKEMDK